MDWDHLRGEVLLDYLSGVGTTPIRIAATPCRYPTGKEWSRFVLNRNSFFVGGEHTEEDALDIINQLGNGDVPDLTDPEATYAQIESLLHLTFRDIPCRDLSKPEDKESKSQRSNISFLASFIFAMVSSTSLKMHEVAEMPLPVLWQMLRARRINLTGEDAPPEDEQKKKFREEDAEVTATQNAYEFRVKALAGDADALAWYNLLNIGAPSRKTPLASICPALYKIKDKALREDLAMVIYGPSGIAYFHNYTVEE